MYLLHSALVHSAATSPKPFHYPHSQMRKLRSREVNQRVLGHTAGVLAQEVGCLQHHLPPTSLLCSEAHHVGAESKTQSWMCVWGAHIGRGKPWMHKGGHMLGGEGTGGTGKKQTPLLSQSRSATHSPWSPHSNPEHQGHRRALQPPRAIRAWLSTPRILASDTGEDSGSAWTWM